MKTNSVFGYSASYTNPNFGMARTTKFSGLFDPERYIVDKACFQALQNSVPIGKLGIFRYKCF